MGKSQFLALFKNRKETSKYVKWLAHYTKPYVWKISLMMLVSLASTGISLWMVDINKKIIDYASAGSSDFKKFLILYACLILGMQIVNVISGLISAVVNEKFSFGIRKQVYDKIINSHWLDVKRYHTGDLMTRLTSDAGNIANGIIGTIPNIIMLGIELVAVFIYLFCYSPMLAVFALAVAPVAALASWWLGKKLKVLQAKVQESESSYRSFLQESLANLLVVKSFANEDYSSRKLSQLRDDRFYWVFKKQKMSVASSTVMSMTFQIGYIIAFTYGATMISKGAISWGTMTLFLSLVNRVQSPILGLARQIPQVVSIFTSAGRVMEIQNIPKEEKLKEHISAEKIGVSVKDVTFGYLDNETVLDNVSLDIKPGEFVAIIGESGIGKTTLIRLIMSFMGNYTGDITFFNQNGETEKANAGTRTFLSYVPQGNTLFSGTIRENIRMGNLNATDEEMYEALKLASGYDFVMELPGGLDCVIGERGHGISEGQAQRIAIARALVRKAPFLILDEATSSLDMETEQKVILGLQELTPRPTCLIITHRKSILEYCDRELKIKDRQMEVVRDFVEPTPVESIEFEPNIGGPMPGGF